MKKASNTTATEEVFSLSADDKELLSNFFYTNKKPSSDLAGVYCVPNMAMPSLRERISGIMEACLENDIQVDGFKVFRSEFNGTLFAKKSGSIKKLMSA